MGRDAFGRYDGRFPAESFEALLPAIYRLEADDKTRIVEWCREHIDNRQAMYQLLLTLAECIAAGLRQIIELEGGTVDGHFASLHPNGNIPQWSLTFGQIVTATLNGDRDMQHALLTTLIDHAETTDDPRDIAHVQVELFALLRFVMHQMLEATRKHDATASAEEVDRG